MKHKINCKVVILWLQVVRALSIIDCMLIQLGLWGARIQQGTLSTFINSAGFGFK